MARKEKTTWSNKFTAVIIAIVLAGFSAHAQQSGTCKWNENPKSWNGTQRELNQCAGERLRHVTDEMDKFYQDQRSYLQSAESKSQLEASQKAWNSYAKYACLYESWPDNGGTIEPMVEGLCMADLITQRIKTLKSYTECRENGCPN